MSGVTIMKISIVDINFDHLFYTEMDYETYKGRTFEVEKQPDVKMLFETFEQIRGAGHLALKRAKLADLEAQVLQLKNEIDLLVGVPDEHAWLRGYS